MSISQVTTFAAVRLGAAAGGNPLEGPAQKVIAIIVTLAAVAVAWAAFKVLARSHGGNVRKDMNVGGSVGIGLVLLGVATTLGVAAAWVSGFINFLI